MGNDLYLIYNVRLIWDIRAERAQPLMVRINSPYIARNILL